MNTISVPASLPGDRATPPRGVTVPMMRPRTRRRSLEFRELLFILAHVPLAIIVRSEPLFATVHAIAVLILGLHWSARRATAHRTALAAAYVAGAEVLWRMSGGAPLYEYGKYASVLLLLAAARRLPGWRRPTSLSIVYFLLLVPSIVLTLQALGISGEAREQISFNLSGPLALAVAVFFFSGCRSSSLDLRQMLVAMLAPLVGSSAVAARSVLTAEVLRFGGESNFTASGGFGPNQVSAVLGLGAIVSLFLAFQTKAQLWRWAYLVISLQLLVQAVLTFSRGGVLNAIICGGLLGVHFLSNARARSTLIVSLILFGFFGTQYIVPRLNEFTGGGLSVRYGDIDPSLRRDIASHEWQIFRENPLLGVGPGIAKDYRRSAFSNPIAAHTEYTRLLAEHGIFGMGALIILLLLAVIAYLRAPTMPTKAWVAVLAGWSMLEMSHAAMRIVAISFLFGLAFVQWHRARPPSTPTHTTLTRPAAPVTLRPRRNMP